ncbi:hypothetical protein [Geoglobus ahangari]
MVSRLVRPPELGNGDEEFKREMLNRMSKEELIERVLDMEKGTIKKSVAAREVAVWAGRAATTAIAGIVLTMVSFGLVVYDATAYAFIMTAGALGFFAYQFSTAQRMINYLKQRYQI